MPDRLSTGLQHHQRGFLAAAAQVYESILASDPRHPDALHLLGLVSYQGGNAPRALELIGAAIALDPGVATYHANLGEVHRALGDYAKAAASCQQALRIQPGFAAAVNNLGLCLQSMGQTAAAVEQFRAALRLEPGFALAHNNLAIALHQMGRKDAAIAHFHKALEFSPTLAEAHANLGRLLVEIGQVDLALTHCREAIRLRPGFVDAHVNLGSAFRELGQLEEARAALAEAVRLDPEHAVACYNLGQVAQDQGKLNESLIWYERSLESKPDFALAHCNRGIVLLELGDREAARHAFRRALGHGPGQAEAYYQLAMVDAGKLGAAELAGLRDLLRDRELSDDERSTAHSGLALVLDAQGDYHGAADQMKEANRLSQAVWTARGHTYDPAAHERLIDGLIATCTPAFFEAVRGFGSTSDQPVFVFGLPRSGTTLTEQILASHSQVFGGGELTLVRDAFESLPRVMSVDGPASVCLGRLDQATAARLAGDILRGLHALNREAPRLVDKMPENYLFLGLLAALFPRARYIHCRRDLRDVAVSCWMTHFRTVSWASDPVHIASRFHAYQRIMEHWRRVLPVRWLDVSYEETVADLESTARRLVAWCGLPWEPACLAFHANRRTVRSASVAQVRMPIYDRSVGRWRHYEEPLRPLLERL
jgi:tetratricopeptide (TPR) repeat protein